MRRLIYLLFYLSPIISSGQTPNKDRNWISTPVFNEDFLGTRSWDNFRVDNTSTWFAFYTSTGITHGSYEHQFFRRENAIFNYPSAGYLTLRAEYKPKTIPDWSPEWKPVTTPYDYISGAIESVQYFKYGYFEMKCTLPPANTGNFPAFWLYSEISRYNEIDIFEHVIRNPTLHPTDYKNIFGTYYTRNQIGQLRANYCLGSGELPLTSFHTYAIEWSPKMIIWYFDGKQIGSAINEAEIPDQSMKILADYAIDNYCLDVNHHTNLFPLEMTIDYIRVYNLNCECERIVSITDNNQLNSYSHSVKKKITIENTSNTIVAPIGGLSLRATDEIIINGNFEVPVGTEFYATTHACPQ
jgi:hypothetical protein